MSEPTEYDYIAAFARRERRRRAARFKQFTAVTTTSGYGLVAGGGWEPLLKAQSVDGWHALAFGLGVAMLVASVYVAPEGEAPDDRR